ncbi:hypothetical protein D3C81_1814140 [compost metagenome]
MHEDVDVPQVLVHRWRQLNGVLIEPFHMVGDQDRLFQERVTLPACAFFLLGAQTFPMLEAMAQIRCQINQHVALHLPLHYEGHLRHSHQQVLGEPVAGLDLVGECQLVRVVVGHLASILCRLIR